MVWMYYVMFGFEFIMMVQSADFIGENCIDNTTQKSGKCTQFNDCSSAKDSIKRYKIYPDICGYEGKNDEPVVCCTDVVSLKDLATCYKSVGYAVPLYRCPPMLAKEENPPACKTFLECPIVCCQENEIISKADSQILKQKYATPPPEVKPLRLSEKKCAEYLVASNAMKILSTGAVGGVNSEAREFPHMAALGYGTKDDIQWQCGGSLISDQHILTAAHCLYSQELGEVQFVRLGDLNLAITTDIAEPQDFEIIQRIVHPDYDPPYHDIALLKLDRPVRYTEYVKPSCLHTTKEVPTYSLFVTGWGALEYGGPTSEHLQKVDLKYYTNENCSRTYKPNARLKNGIHDDLQICAGGYETIKDSCQGDSGGPLQYSIANYLFAYNIVGVTSFGQGCGTPNIPGVYTRVSHYVPWIEKTIWSNK